MRPFQPLRFALSARIAIGALIAAGVVSACAPSTPAPEANLRNPPTLPAPATFTEARDPITINNITELRYLGRLDQTGTSSTIFAYAVSPDATRLVGLNNEEILSWDLLTGRRLFKTARGDVTRIYYSPDKTELYGIDGSGMVTVYDANTGARQTTFQGHAAYANVAAFSPDAGWLALGGSDGTIKVWDTAARQSLVTINAQPAAITALAFSADGERLATADATGLIRLWNWRDRTLAAERALDPPYAVSALAFAPEVGTPTGVQIAIGTGVNAYLWQPDNDAAPLVLEPGRGGAAQILRFAPPYVLGGSRLSGLTLWRANDGSVAARLPGTSGENISASFSPDGTLLLTAVLDGGVALWNLVQLTGDSVGQSTLDVGTQQIVYVHWTEDGRLLLLFDAAGPVYLWGVG